MTKLVVFCDGTWNTPNMTETTSVHELSEAVVKDPAQGQLVGYFPGIGTDERFDTPAQAFLRRWGGGAFGWGLDAKVKQAYQFISIFYRPGDEIYLFGFSRGAYTARSVAGMIRKCGIVQDSTPEGINAAFRLYRKRGAQNAPDEAHILRERRALSPQFATSQKDLDWRADGSEMVNIAYLGVFDTVGARGIPPALFGPLATLWNLQYRFHDAVLSSLVKSARHAIAVDERRVFYKPARWNNLTRLNGDHAPDDPLRPYQQCWFVGNHGIVGGSAEDGQPLSVIALDWVLQGAGRLALKPGSGPDMRLADPHARSKGVTAKGGVLSAWRKGPQEGDDVHPSVRERAARDPGYRPKTLRDWLT